MGQDATSQLVWIVLCTAILGICSAGALTGCIGPVAQWAGPGFQSGVRVPYVDPAAGRISITPAQSAGPVDSPYVLVATITDHCGNPLGGQRVEWVLERGGVGQIVAVDHAGRFRIARGKVDNTYAVSTTSAQNRQLTRGTPDPADDIYLGPGQTWCLISSALTGETVVSVYAPGINDWKLSRAVAKRRWTDVFWDFPPPASLEVGSQHTLVTRVFRPSTGQGHKGYSVRYRIVGGPAANFTPGGARELEVPTDFDGIARATITQDVPEAGTNQVQVEILRPSDIAGDVPLVRGEVPIQWVGLRVTDPLSVEMTGQAEAIVGDTVTFVIRITNTGTTTLRNFLAVDRFDKGLEHPKFGAQPLKLEDIIPDLAPGQTHELDIQLKANSAGRLCNHITVTAQSGAEASAQACTNFTMPQNRDGERNDQ